MAAEGFASGIFGFALGLHIHTDGEMGGKVVVVSRGSKRHDETAQDREAEMGEV